MNNLFLSSSYLLLIIGFFYIFQFELSLCATYTIDVISAKGLPDKDGLRDNSDPFTKVFGYQDNGINKKKTSTKIDKVNPVRWNEVFTFSDNDGGFGDYTGFYFEIFDDDKSNSDDFIGRTLLIPICDIPCDNTFRIIGLNLFNRDINSNNGDLTVGIKKSNCGRRLLNN